MSLCASEVTSNAAQIDKLKFVGRLYQPQMRLDLFLKLSRLCPGRSLAQKLCDAGLVSINGKPAKSAHSVKPADEISLRIRNRLRIVCVTSVPTARSVAKTEAATLYTTIKDEELDDSTVSLSV